MTIACYDGKLVDHSSLTLRPADFGFARGIAVYELTRVYGGRPFRLRDHIARFLKGAASFGIAAPDAAAIEAALLQVLSANNLPQSVVKFYLTAGESGSGSGFGFGGNEGFTPHFMIIEEEVTYLHPDAPRGLDVHKRGITVKTIPVSRDCPEVKSVNYALGFRALRQGEGAGFDDILFTHRDGYVTEGSTSNVFAAIGGRLVTPGRGMLYGITRKVLLELAPRAGIEVEERDIPLSELPRVTEAFMSGSYTEMMPIRSLDGRDLPATTDAPLFAKLRAALTAAIRSA